MTSPRLCRECDVQFSLGYGVNVPTRAAILELPESAWMRAVNADGEPREGAWVAELTPHVKLAQWPTGTRLICRRERPHPGAQLSFTDHDGHRFQCFITDQIGGDLAFLEADHRQHAQVEDRVKTLKATGGDMLPFHSFQANAAWLEVALTATDIIVRTQALTLDALRRRHDDQGDRALPRRASSAARATSRSSTRAWSRASSSLARTRSTLSPWRVRYAIVPATSAIRSVRNAMTP